MLVIFVAVSALPVKLPVTLPFTAPVKLPVKVPASTLVRPVRAPFKLTVTFPSPLEGLMLILSPATKEATAP